MSGDGSYYIKPFCTRRYPNLSFCSSRLYMEERNTSFSQNKTKRKWDYNTFAVVDPETEPIHVKTSHTTTCQTTPTKRSDNYGFVINSSEYCTVRDEIRKVYRIRVSQELCRDVSSRVMEDKWSTPLTPCFSNSLYGFWLVEVTLPRSQIPYRDRRVTEVHDVPHLHGSNVSYLGDEPKRQDWKERTVKKHILVVLSENWSRRVVWRDPM